MKYQEHFLEKHSARRSGKRLERARAIVVHYTACAGASADDVAAYWQRTAHREYASAHVLIGDKEAVQVMPYTEVAWHVGSAYTAPQNAPEKYTEYGMRLIDAIKGTQYGKGMISDREAITPNYCTIGVEMCQEGAARRSIGISEATRENTIEIVRDLMKAYEIGVEDVVTHYEVVGWKSCPAIAIAGGGYGTLSARAQRSITLSAWWRKFVEALKSDEAHVQARHCTDGAL